MPDLNKLGGRLKSWTEIASYLNRNTRTAIRWEKERGLPVHRPPGGRRARTVYAFTEELDAWMLGGQVGEASQQSKIEGSPAVVAAPPPPPTTGYLRLMAAMASFGVLLVGLPLAAIFLWPTPEGQRPLALPLSVVRSDYPASGSIDARQPQAKADGVFGRAVTLATALQKFYLALEEFDATGLPRMGYTGANSTEFEEKPPEVKRNGKPDAATAPAIAGKNGIVIGDFNGDGRPDLAVIRPNAAVVAILLGSGDGNYELKQSVHVGPGTNCIASADLNHDGKPDLVVCTRHRDTNPSLEVYLGKGDGSFRAAGAFETEGSLRSLAISDFDGDGNPDLVTASLQDGITVLRGRGDGTFRFPEHYQACQGTGYVTAVDFDRDGHPDLLALGSRDDSLCFLHGNGDGTFARPEKMKTGQQPDSISVADLDGDGRLDIAVSNVNGETISVFLNRTPTREMTFNEKVSAAWAQLHADESRNR